MHRSLSTSEYRDQTFEVRNVATTQREGAAFDCLSARSKRPEQGQMHRRVRPSRGSCMLGVVEDSKRQTSDDPARNWFGRYTVGARLYDVLSLEWPIYRAARRVAIDMMCLRRGDCILDIGCGTGLNFSLLQEAVGPTGRIIGIDLSPSMLAQAQARVQRNAWQNTRLIRGDAGAGRVGDLIGGGPVDGTLTTYALSIIDHGQVAWESMLQVTRPGGRVAVVDLALPTGGWSVMAPLARLACMTGGVDRHREPWRWAVADLTGVQERTLRGGHIRVAAGAVAARASRGDGR